MTKKQKDAKMKEMQEWIEKGVPREAKDPSSELDDLHINVIDMKQRESEKEKSIEVIKGQDVQTVLSNAGIKTVGERNDEIKESKNNNKGKNQEKYR